MHESVEDTKLSTNKQHTLSPVERRRNGWMGGRRNKWFAKDDIGLILSVQGGSIGFFSSLTIQRFFLFFHDIIS